MKSTAYVRMGLEFSARTTLELIEDMKDAPLTFPTSKGGNHPLWVLGHLTLSEAGIIQEIMLGRPNPLAHWKELLTWGLSPSRRRPVTPRSTESRKRSRRFAPARSRCWIR